VPPIVVTDTPRPRRLAILKEAHDHVAEALHIGRRRGANCGIASKRSKPRKMPSRQSAIRANCPPKKTCCCRPAERGAHHRYGAMELMAILGIRMSVIVVVLAAALSALAHNVAADTISAAQRARLDAEIAQVPADLSARFDARYRDWTKTFQRPDIAVSSSSGAVRNSDEFRALVALGPQILPLVVDKLLQPHEFFALQLYDVLQDRADLRDADAFQGEQKRALATARRWLSR
jgi:hypothetical protein